MKRHFVALLAAAGLVLTAPPAHAQGGDAGGGGSPPAGAAPAAAPVGGDAAANGIKARGFLLEFHLGTNVIPVPGIGGLPLIATGFFGGYKLGKLIFGLRLDVLHTSSHDKAEDPNSTSTTTNSTTQLVFAPTFQFHIIEKAKLAIFVGASIDMGPVLQRNKTVFESTGLPTVTTENNDDLALAGFSASFGMRYFLGPNFAIGCEAGVRGLWTIDKDENNAANSTQTTTTGQLAVFGTLGFLVIM